MVPTQLQFDLAGNNSESTILLAHPIRFTNSEIEPDAFVHMSGFSRA